MKDKFNLSEKINIEGKKPLILDLHEEPIEWILKEDVKEFIRRLKEKAVEVPNDEGIYDGDEAVMVEEIDTLAGDKLK